MSRPREGDYVHVYDDMRDEWREGVVVSLLSTQFTYVEETSTKIKTIMRYSFYADEWRVAGPHTKSGPGDIQE